MSKSANQIVDEGFIQRVEHRTHSTLAEGKDREALQLQEHIEDQPGLGAGLEGKLRQVSREAGRHAALSALAVENGRTHYLENQAAYHEAAVTEADEAGVKIEVQLPKSSAEQIEVHKS